MFLNAQPPKFEWADYWGGKGNDQAYSTTADGQGNIYTVGSFNDKVDFDPGSGKAERTSSGSTDVFLSKFSSNGKFLWVKTFGSKDLDLAGSIMLDANGDLILSGAFIGTADFDPGSGQTTLKSNGSRDAFVSKFDTSGKFLWALSWGGSNSDGAGKVASDDDGNLYITIGFRGKVDLDPGSGTHYLTASGVDIDPAIIKLSSSGQFRWAKRIKGSKSESFASLDLDNDKNIYLTGNFSGSPDFDPGTSYVPHTAVNRDMFILKLDSNGNYVWSGNTGSSSQVLVYEIIVTGSGNIVITGLYQGTTDFDLGSGTSTLKHAGQGDIFVAEYTKSGNLSWVRALSGSKNEFPKAMSMDKDGSLYVHGSFSGTVDFNPGLGQNTLTSGGQNSNAFVVKLDKVGDFEWVKHLGGSGSITPHDIFVDSKKSVHVCGGFRGKIDFDPGTGVLEYDGIYQDPYLLKISQCYETKTTISPVVCGDYKSPSGKYNWKKSGTYRDTLQNVGGCDSVVTIKLTVNRSSSSQITATNCVSYLTPSGKTIYQSGKVIDTIPNYVGCDSIITINATINKPTNSAMNLSSCGAYTSPSGKTWTASGSYTDTILNALGCDSIVTIELVIHTPTFSQVTATSCNQYISPSGKTWTSTAIYKDTIPNTAGCDSVITIDLGISNSQYSTVSDTFCGLYNSPSGKYQWSSSGSYVDTLITQGGCDSIVTVQLTMETLDVSVSAIDDSLHAHVSNATYQWLDCGNNHAPILGANQQTFVPSNYGSYAVQISQYACTDTSACYDVIADNVRSSYPELSFTAYPNPTSGDVTVKFQNITTNSEITVFNSTGVEVLKLNSAFGDDVRFTINDRSGLFIIVVTTSTSSKSLYVIKES